MRPFIFVAAGIVALAAAATPAKASQTAPPSVPQVQAHQDFSAAKRKKRVRGPQAYGRGQQQIACTQFGCNPIPRGCRVVPGRNPFTWNPSGFDEVQCPYYR